MRTKQCLTKTSLQNVLIKLFVKKIKEYTLRIIIFVKKTIKVISMLFTDLVSYKSEKLIFLKTAFQLKNIVYLFKIFGKCFKKR